MAARRGTKRPKGVKYTKGEEQQAAAPFSGCVTHGSCPDSAAPPPLVARAHLVVERHGRLRRPVFRLELPDDAFCAVQLLVFAPQSHLLQRCSRTDATAWHGGNVPHRTQKRVKACSMRQWSMVPAKGASEQRPSAQSLPAFGRG